MGGHQRRQPGLDQLFEGRHVGRGDSLVGTVIHRRFVVGIAPRAAVAGEVLAHRRHAGAAQARHQPLGQPGRRRRRAMIGAVPQEDAGAGVQIQHRGETEIHPDRGQFVGQQPTGLFHQGQGQGRVLVVEGAETPARGQAGETLPKSLHSSALLIHGDQQRGLAQGAHCRREGHQGLRLRVVAGKQDDPARQGVRQHLPFVRLQLDAPQIQHDGP